MARKLKGAVVVVTGASSGIGRATAEAFAAKGASVVLAARRSDELRRAAEACERAGPAAVTVPTDVTDDEAVAALRTVAVERFGRIDVWINNAGVGAFGRYLDTPHEVARRVLQVNLGGALRGSRAALEQFVEQGSGALINVASLYGKLGGPHVGPYVASKHAVVGLTESLRLEFRGDKHISISTILPAAIDTPFFQHAANYSGRVPKPVHPVVDAERVAAAIVHCARRPRREVVVGGGGRLTRVQRLMLPGRAEAAATRYIDVDHFHDIPAAATPGNVFSPISDAEEPNIGGGWKTSQHTRRRWVGGLAGAAAAGAAAWQFAGRPGGRD